MTKRNLKYSVLFYFYAVCFCYSATVYGLEVMPGEFIVRYKVNKNSISSLSKTSLNQNMRLKKSWNQINTHFFKAGSGGDIRDDHKTLQELREDPNVLFAEPNYMVRAQMIPHFPTNAPIQAPESWEEEGFTAANTPAPVTIAMLDSGLDIQHEVFRNTGRLWNNEQEISGVPGVDDDGNGYIDDFHGWNFIDNNNNLSDESGHGSHTAGIAVSSTENILNITAASAGSQKVQLMILKFLDADGIGTTADAINAIYYAVDNGAKILSNSWGGSGFSAALQEAIAYSFFENTVFVAAAGNSASDNDQSPIFPANYDIPNIISVGATDDSDNLAFFSNFGRQSVDVSAPGVNILSVAPGGDHDNFVSSTGTSMATPFVSGLAALMVREAPQFSGFQIRRDILASVDVFGKLSNASLTSGRVNFLQSVNLATANSSEPTIIPEFTPDLNFSSRELASLAEGEDGGFGCARVKSVYKSQNDKVEGGRIGLNHIFMVVALFAPFALISFVRRRTSYERQYKRYSVDFKGALFDSEGKKIDVQVCTFSLGGAGVKVNFKKDDFEGKNNLILKFETKNGELKEYTCKAVSSYKNQIGLCFD